MHADIAAPQQSVRGRQRCEFAAVYGGNRRLELEAMTPGHDHARALLDAVLSYPGVPRHVHTPASDGPRGVLLPMHLVKGEVDIRIFTMITTLGTPLDVTAQELRVESYFPADERTDAWVRSLAS